MVLQINEQIKVLEEAGLKLAYKTKQLLHDKDANTKLFDFYELWKIELLHLAEKCKNRDFELSIKKPDGVTSSFFTDLAFKEKMPLGAIRYGLTDEDVSVVVMSEDTIIQIHAMEAGINSRIDALSTLRKSFAQSVDKIITIHVDTDDKKLSRTDGVKNLSCSFKRGKNFDFVLKIIHSQKPIAAKKLSRNKSIQDISTNIRRINIKIETDLRLSRKKKFFVNPDKRSGYRLNEAYELTLS